ncbi:uracil-DNA glycosylase [Terrabacter aerolatus]|uniref:Uracil-DNA glycosylase n=1 Tax=Terrabacter aerolatus TaxID=422442 RepID=A0A512D344_9MICO|nr:uracil-DNA glycosylase [Terrabacter aerolatus]GEO30888.1 uracil-DNA glycosylase [Terrabacter aerolatus]
MLPDGWDVVLGEVLRSRGWSELTKFVAQERKAGTVYPPAENVFRAFELTPYSMVRVVILGQDPYHGEGQAQGLAFSIAHGRLTPSLRKVLQELERDPEVAPPDGGNLEGWARQGVLLLNAALTVRAGSPNSHRGRGWEDFTDAVISALNQKTDRVVFLLWGAAAHRKARLITNPRHTVIRAAHPAARASAHDPLVGSCSFSRANKALTEAGLPAIRWDRSDPSR